MDYNIGLDYSRYRPQGHPVRHRRHSPFDEVATVSVFFHEFESIHPFEDGNGCTGRAPLHICLQESRLRNCMLCLIEEELVGDTGMYYDLLTYTDSTHNYGPFVNHVAESLLTAYQKAVDEFGSRDRLAGFDENTKHLAQLAGEREEFTLVEASTWVLVTGQSVRSKLEELVSAGILAKTGRTRGMRYIFNDPFRDLRNGIDPEGELRRSSV